jgi:hypothetical protein
MSTGRLLTLLVCALPAAGLVSRAPAASSVALIVTPNEGIQPQAAVDNRGVLHLIYFTGDPSAGDLYYVQRAPGSTAFSSPLRVNTEPRTAIATGSVRGGHLALGRDGWIHVAWDAARPSDQGGGATYTPMYYTRLAPAAHAFEAQRAIGHTVYLDGGTITADQAGHVYLAWHARGAVEGEAHRAVYVATSADDGAHFTQEKPLVDEGGVCSCCAVAALADRSGRLNILYRAATDSVHRDATWFSDSGGSVHREVLDRWDLNACPMTTFALAQAPDGVVGAWQTERQIFIAKLDPVRGSHAQPLSGTGVRAHPSVAVNDKGERLIAWADGTAWARGGTVSWERQSPAGIREDGAEHVAPVPVWGLVAAVALRDGSFAIVH